MVCFLDVIYFLENSVVGKVIDIFPCMIRNCPSTCFRRCSSRSTLLWWKYDIYAGRLAGSYNVYL